MPILGVCVWGGGVIIHGVFENVTPGMFIPLGMFII